jgi:hypothetical protein
MVKYGGTLNQMGCGRSYGLFQGIPAFASLHILPIDVDGRPNRSMEEVCLFCLYGK